jgi:hypothetical protein
LGAQVSAVQYGFNERAKVKVESKEHMRERGLPSPDELDAVGLAFAGGGPEPPYMASDDYINALRESAGLPPLAKVETA